jgi:hypothetical protein
MFTTLQKLQHKIMTAFGYSVNSYGSRRVVPLQGIGQGNGCGPACWAVMSTPIINMMRAAGFGAFFLSALSVMLITFVCYAFVDDTDLVHTAKDVHTSGEVVMKEMQEAIDMWEGGIRASGGALVPAKSYWYLIDFVWEKNEWRYSTIEDIPGDISIKDVCGTRRVILSRHNADVAKETLGVWLAMDGNNREEIVALRQKAEEWADNIRTGFLDRNDAWYALNFTIMKSLEYPMMATTMSKQEWNFILRPILLSGLPKCGVARTFPREVVHGPLEFQGLNVYHPHTLQGIVHIQTCLQQGVRQSITGDLLRASIEQLKLELGLQGYPLRQDFKKYGMLATNCWLKTVWEFLWDENLGMEDTCKNLALARKDDQFLMATFSRYGFAGKDLLVLNRCRMFLQAVTLSDITTADGISITPQSWAGSREIERGTGFIWPRQPRELSSADWSLWKRSYAKSREVKE